MKTIPDSTLLLLCAFLCVPNTSYGQSTIQDALKQYVNLRIEGAPRSEFEKKEEFEKRVTAAEKRMRARRHALVSKQYPGTFDVELGNYDPDREVYPFKIVGIDIEEPLELRISVSDAKTVKQFAKKLKATGQFWLEEHDIGEAYRRGPHVYAIKRIQITAGTKVFHSEPLVKGTIHLTNAVNQVHIRGYSAVSPDNSLLADADWADGIIVTEIATSREIHRIALGRAQNLAFLPQNRLFAFSWDESSAHIWDLSSGQKVTSYRGLKYSTCSPDGRYVSLWTGDSISILDAGTSSKLWSSSCRAPIGMVFSSNGLFAFGTAEYGRNGDIVVVSTNTMEQVHQFSLTQVQYIAISNDGTELVALSNTQNLRIWDIPSSKELMSLNLGYGAFRHLAFSPDNRLLFIDGNVWDIRKGIELRVLHSQGAYLKPSLDGTLLLGSGRIYELTYSEEDQIPQSDDTQSNTEKPAMPIQQEFIEVTSDESILPLDQSKPWFRDIEYPQPVLEGKVKGEVSARVFIDEEGSVKKAQILKSVDPLCDSVVVQVLLRNRFKPLIRGGREVKAQFELSHDFSFEDLAENEQLTRLDGRTEGTHGSWRYCPRARVIERLRFDLFIDETGTVVGTRVLQPSGYVECDNEFLASVKNRKFRPIIRNKKAVKIKVPFDILMERD